MQLTQYPIMDLLICFRVRYSQLMQVLEVWHIAGYIELYMLCCMYIRDKVNCLLYIYIYIYIYIYSGRLSMNIYIYISIQIFIFIA